MSSWLLYSNFQFSCLLLSSLVLLLVLLLSLLSFKKWSRFIEILFTLERQPIIAFQTENAFPSKQMLKPCKWNTMEHNETKWNTMKPYK